MIPTHHTVWGIGLVLGLMVGGCAAPGLPPLSYSSRQISTVAWAEVFDRAREVLGERGYDIDRARPAEGFLRTRPIPVHPRGTLRRRGFQLSSPRSLRRVVLVRLARAGRDVTVRCRVVEEERVTESHRLLRGSLIASDLPTETPIDREGATTAEQNEVWRTVRRDKAAESKILEGILAKTGQPE